MHKPKVVILGGGYAGLMAASRLARSGAADLTLVDRNPAFEQRIRLHQVIAGQPVPQGEYRHWLAPAGVRFHQAQVRDIQPGQRRLLTDNGALPYDFLLIALGSQIDPGRIPGAAEHGASLVSQPQCQQLAGKVAALGQAAGRLVLVGAGLTQLETAAELAQRWPRLRISLITSGPAFAAFNPAAQQYLRRYLHRAGVELLEQNRVLGLEAGVCRTEQGSVPFDLCLSAPGFRAPPLLQSLGAPLDAQGRVAVTASLQLVGNDRIWVAGDCATSPWSGRSPLRMSCAAALPMGAQAGENLAAVLQGKAPRDLSFGFAIRCISLGRNQGLIQSTQWDDIAGTRIVTGRAGAWIKEQVCRMTFNVPRWELRTGWRLYRWPAGKQGKPIGDDQVAGSARGNRDGEALS